MSFFRFRRAVAVGVIAALVLVIVPLPAAAGEPALLQGRVTAADGVSAMSGVVVTLVNERTRSTFASDPTNDRGAFQASAPAGSYRLVAETPKGAFLASGSVKLAGGENPTVSLALKEAQEGEAGAPAAAAPPAAQSGMAPWAKWVIVGGIVVAGLLVIDAVSDDEEPASGF